MASPVGVGGAATSIRSTQTGKETASFCDAPVAEVNMRKPDFLCFVLHGGSGRRNRPSEGVGGGQDTE